MCTLWSPVLPYTVYQTATDQHNYTLEPTGRFWSLLLYTMWHLSWFFQLLCIESLKSKINSLTLPQTDHWHQLDLTGADGPTLRTSSQVHAHLRVLWMRFYSLVSPDMRLWLISAMSRSWSLPPLSGFDFSYKLYRSGLIQAYRFEPDVDSCVTDELEKGDRNPRQWQLTLVKTHISMRKMLDVDTEINEILLKSSTVLLCLQFRRKCYRNRKSNRWPLFGSPWWGL